MSNSNTIAEEIKTELSRLYAPTSDRFETFTIGDVATDGKIAIGNAQMHTTVNAERLLAALADTKPDPSDVETVVNIWGAIVRARNKRHEHGR